jgi:endonuclease/exonuclease/phosphatase family metal-dependent hydrolase
MNGEDSIMQKRAVMPHRALKMLSYNVAYFDAQDWRHEAILSLVLRESADVVALLEVSSSFFRIIAADIRLQERYLLSDPSGSHSSGAHGGEYLLVARWMHAVKNVHFWVIALPSFQGRKLVCCDVSMEHGTLRFGAAHLESGRLTPFGAQCVGFTMERCQKKQLDVIIATLQEWEGARGKAAGTLLGAIFAGDCNFGDGSVQERYMEEQGFVDAWRYLVAEHEQMETMGSQQDVRNASSSPTAAVSSESPSTVPGEDCRIDRFYCFPGPGTSSGPKPILVGLLGNQFDPSKCEAIPEKLTPLCPSDHFCLYGEFLFAFN